MKKKSVWSGDFSKITLATILSIIGGEAMNLPVSLLVFDETKSTAASAFILICGMLPDIILPILVAPLIDRGKKKTWIVGLDLLQAFAYLGTGILICGMEFQYLLYVIFTLMVGTISVFYRLAYDAWFPDLIPEEFEQQGYAVSSVLYPTVSIIMAPVSAFLYEHVKLYQIFFMVAFLTFVSILIENSIHENRTGGEIQEYSFKHYLTDIKEGIEFIRQEKGIRNIYTYMGITNGANEGVNLLYQAYFQTSSFLTVTMFGFLKSAEMTGRMLSSLIWYKKEIPVKKRYGFTKCVYFIYESMNGLLLFLPFGGMVLNRFLCGGLGCGSATIREAAVQSYLPGNIRARVNAFFNVMFAAGGILFQMIAGFLGNVMSYRKAVLIIEMVTFLGMFFLIIFPKEENRVIYEAQKTDKK